jgi:hypothetical protein
MLIYIRESSIIKGNIMKSEIYNNDIYLKKAEKLNSAKIKLDEIKAKVNSLENELLEIRLLDKILHTKKEINIYKNRPIYKDKNIIIYKDLMYQRFPYDKLYTWYEAIEEAKKLNLSNYTGWRLPTIEELEKLLIKRTFRNSKGDKHYILKEFIEGMPKESFFWTIKEEGEQNAWVIDFSHGYDYWRRKATKLHALFVRDIDKKYGSEV